MEVAALDINIIATRLVSEIPLVIAFIFFSLKIITVYQDAQRQTVESYQLLTKEQAERHAENQKETSERTEKMITAIISQWAVNCDKRDLDMRNFLQGLRDNDSELIQRLSKDIEANTTALSVLQNQLFTISQAQPPQRQRSAPKGQQ